MQLLCEWQEQEEVLFTHAQNKSGLWCSVGSEGGISSSFDQAAGGKKTNN